MYFFFILLRYRYSISICQVCEYEKFTFQGQITPQSTKMSTIQNNLIVNYLPQFLTDIEFKNMFLTIGPLLSHKIVRDKATGFSYGFGFIEYKTEKDAARAVKVFDYLPMYGKRIRVQHANKGDDLTKNHNIYVKNIPSSYTEADLDKLFEPFGKIVTSKVLVDLQTMQSKNVGFVLYESKSEADKAISELNGKTCPGTSNVLYLKYADDSNKKAVKNVHPVLPHILPQGPVPPPQGNGFQSPVGPPGPVRNQNSNRFRFNPMAREPESPSYYSSGNQQNLMAKEYGSGFTSPPPRSGMSSPVTDLPQGPGPYSLFVYNIGDDAEDRELWALFSPFGTVLKCTVMTDPQTKVSRGYGFVDFANVIEAANAIKNLHGFLYKGRQINVSFKQKK